MQDEKQETLSPEQGHKRGDEQGSTARGRSNRKNQLYLRGELKDEKIIL